MRERKPAPEMIYRDMTLELDRAAIEKRALEKNGDDRIPIAISSEYPVERKDFWSGDPYSEILDHSRNAIDLSYARDGLPFLADHNTREQLGIVEGISIDNDKVLRGLVRFSQRAAAKDLRQDMLDGIRKKISVGYRQLEIVVTRSMSDDTPDEVRVTRWQPMEASSVSIPADYSVGVGRSMGDPSPADAEAAGAVRRRHSPTTLQFKRRPMNGKQTEEDRDGIRALTNDHPELKPQLDVMAVRGDTYDDARAFVLDTLRKRLPEPSPTGFGGFLDVGNREARGEQFSLRRFIAGEAGEKVDNGRDREILQEFSRKSGVRARQGGYVLPIDLRELSVRAAMTTGGSAANAVFSGYKGDINILRNAPLVERMGASTFPGNVGNVAFVRQTGDPTASWVAEAPGSDVTDTNPTFDQVTGAPKSLQAMTLLSKLSLIQTTPQMEDKVRASIAAKHGLAIDLAAINGLGSSNQPRGILNTSGIGSVALGTNGLAPTYDSVVDLETAVAVPNALDGSLGYLSTPGIRGKLRKTAKLTNSIGESVWEGGLEGNINGYKAMATNQIPSTLTKGTSTDCHAIIFGNWSELYICEWGTFEILVDPYTLAGRNIVRVVSYQAVDILVAHAASFAAVLDARTV